MAEKKSLKDSIAAFSNKFNKMTDEDKELQENPLSKEDLLQNEINRREEERVEKLRHLFQDYLEPRTQDIENDEVSLLKAYDLFCKVNELSASAQQEGSDARLRSTEIVSPLCAKGDYTLGEQMAFLRLWFLQKHPETEFIPEFIRAENGRFYLDFTARELWTPSSLEKEILLALEEPASNS